MRGCMGRMGDRCDRDILYTHNKISKSKTAGTCINYIQTHIHVYFSLILRIPMVKGKRTDSCQVFSDFHVHHGICVPRHVHAYKHSHTLINV